MSTATADEGEFAAKDILPSLVDGGEGLVHDLVFGIAGIVNMGKFKSLVINFGIHLGVVFRTIGDVQIDFF